MPAGAGLRAPNLRTAPPPAPRTSAPPSCECGRLLLLPPLLPVALVMEQLGSLAAVHAVAHTCSPLFTSVRLCPPCLLRRYIVCGKHNGVPATCANGPRGNIGFRNSGSNNIGNWNTGNVSQSSFVSPASAPPCLCSVLPARVLACWVCGHCRVLPLCLLGGLCLTCSAASDAGCPSTCPPPCRAMWVTAMRATPTSATSTLPALLVRAQLGSQQGACAVCSPAWGTRLLCACAAAACAGRRVSWACASGRRPLLLCVHPSPTPLKDTVPARFQHHVSTCSSSPVKHHPALPCPAPAGNVGHSNSGSGNSGNLNDGQGNTGDLNKGQGNTGTLNIGQGNTGYNNVGQGNTGNQNLGQGNTGNQNNGAVSVERGARGWRQRRGLGGWLLAAAAGLLRCGDAWL